MRCYNIQYRVDAEQATMNDVKDCKLGMIPQRDSGKTARISITWNIIYFRTNWKAYVTYKLDSDMEITNISS